MKKLHYNSPVILTFFFLSLAVLALRALDPTGWALRYFSAFRSPITPSFFVRLFGHVLGHWDFTHFSGNMVLFLVIGPPMEEKYGSRTLLAGILLTAFISGALHCLLFPDRILMGASGIVFMLILLSSLAGMKAGTIPLTLILVAVIYLGQEVYSALFVRDNIAHFMHLVGGLCGAGFGLLVFSKKQP